MQSTYPSERIVGTPVLEDSDTGGAVIGYKDDDRIVKHSLVL
jgi:hypothetical protein